MDGYLKIKTKLDNSGIDKDINNLENKIKKLDTDNSKLSTEQSSLQEEINKYDELRNEADRYKNKIKELEDEKAKIKSIPRRDLIINNQEYKDITDKIKSIKQEYIKVLKDIEKQKITKESKDNLISKTNNNYLSKIDGLNNQRKQIVTNIVPNTSNIDSQIETMKQKYKQATNEIDKQAPKIDKVAIKLEKVKSKQDANNAKISQFRDKIDQINLKKAENGVNNVGKGIQNAIGKIGRMTMAVFGIRTAFSAVKSAISMVSQYNPQIAADFEYMRYCIANALAPAIQNIIKLLYTVLSYVNAITSAWFGINLFSNSSAKNFQKMQKGASGTAKSAKEIQKSLQGFDEMNVLQDDSSSDTGGTSGVSSPSMDLSNMQADIPKWLKWIIDNKDLILGVLGGIATAVAAIKIAHFINEVTGLTGGISRLIGKLGILKSLGIAVVIAGIVLLIKDIIAFIKDPSWSNFGKILTDIGIIILGISMLIRSWKLAIVGIIGIIGGMIIKLFSQKKAILSVKDAQKQLEEATKSLKEANDSYIDSVDRAEDAQKKLEEAQKKTGLSGEDLFKKVQEGTLDYRNMTAEQKEVYKAYLNNEQAQEDLKDATEKLTEAKKNEKIASWENKLAVAAEKGQYDEYKNAVVEAFKKGELSADEARDLIGKSMSEMSRDSQKTFMEDLPDSIKNGLDPKNYETFGQKLCKWFSGIWEGIRKGASELSKIKFNVTSEVISGGANRGISGGFATRISMPKLAQGTVLSRATPVIAGEAGKEAIIPLENHTEGLELIADKIASRIGSSGGAYIIQLDGRTIQRGFAKRNQQLAFATNGR